MTTPEPGLWYAAAKYSSRTKDGHWCLAGEEANFRLACNRAGRLIDEGWLIFSPIAMSHAIIVNYAPHLEREEHEAWYRLDNRIIEIVPFAGIILPPEWRESTGCRAEKLMFENMGRKVRYFHEPCDVTVNG